MAERKRIIGICISQLQDPGNAEMVRTICRHIEAEQYRALIYGCFTKMDYVDSFAKGEASVFQDIPMQELSALVVFGETIQYRELLEKLRDQALEADTPVITIDYEMEGCFNIQLDYQSTFEQLVRHVVEEHHCRKPFMMAGFEGNQFSDERIEMYKKVLKENDIPVREEHIAYGDFWADPARVACEKWMERKDDLPDAVICANDMMGITVCGVLQEHGLRVPEDVIVTGFDGLELTKFCTPRLTTAKADPEEIAAKLMKILQDCMERGIKEPYSVMISFHIIRSESCGCKSVCQAQPNKYVMEVYGSMAHSRIHVNNMFRMMTRLTEGNSVMDMLKKLPKYIKMVTKRDLYFFVNKKFCKYTDIPLGKDFQKEHMLLLFAQINGQFIIPLTEVEDRNVDHIPDEMWDGGHILFIPIHWQEEVYGYVAMRYSTSVKVDYEKLNDFIMTLTQTLGTVKRQSQLHEMYIRDALTSLYNRRGFYGKLNQQMKKLSKKPKKIFLASVDLDKLKYINDNYGHSEGDVAIRKIGEILEKSVEEGGFCARFGGDEFVAAYLWNGEKSERDYMELFQKKMRKQIDQWNREEAKPYLLDASLGMIQQEIISVGDIDELMKQADDNMYNCKERHHSIRNARRDD